MGLGEVENGMESVRVVDWSAGTSHIDDVIVVSERHTIRLSHSMAWFGNWILFPPG